MDLEKLLSKYNYQYSKELIAQAPAKPRDSARLLIYDRQKGGIFFDTFRNLGNYLPENSLLVFNQTKVVPARLAVNKETGGKVMLLYINKDQSYIKVIADRKLNIGGVLKMKNKVIFKVTGQREQFYFLKPFFPISKINQVLQKYGQTPLPPYIKHPTLNETKLRTEYQSVFATKGLSVAAPTASLHFTKQLISRLKKQGIGVCFVTLNVNLGTFAPLTKDNLKNKSLHTETFEIDKKTAGIISGARQQGKKIIAVGTTVVRALESAAKNGELALLNGQTNLFIQPGYKFQIVDSLITNFHVPKSSLLMLVSALTGRKKLLNVYEKAIKRKFRLFSFGDGMLIL